MCGESRPSGRPGPASEVAMPVVSAVFGDLAGQAAIVTGASRGIGSAIAEFLARQGMRLVLSARSAEHGEALAGRLRDRGADCLWITADVATDEGARRVFEAAAERFGRVNLLVANAAHLASRAFEDLDEEAYRESFEANVRMVYGLGRRSASHMAKAGGGCIVNLSSVGGLRAHRGLAGYDASKGAIDALTRSMAVDLAPHNIRVNAVAPGATRAGRAGQSHVPPRRHEGIPLGRTACGLDVAAAVAFLASDAAAYITGQVLYVDGGLTTQLTPPGTWI